MNLAFIVGLLSIEIFGFINCQIPIKCAHNVSMNRKTCCPKIRENELPCGAPFRGECGGLTVFHEPILEVFHIDDRYEWPKRFFHRICHCKGNFFGVACEDCKFGWSGNNCDVRKTYKRRNILSYTPDEKALFVKIMKKSNEILADGLILFERDALHSDPLFKPKFIHTTVHNYIAALHTYAARRTLFKDKNLCKKYGFLDLNHGVTMFSLWHRYFIMLWERELRKIGKKYFNFDDFTAPYWDWIDATSCEVCTNDLVGETGEFDESTGIYLLNKNSHFYKFPEYCSPPEESKEKCFGCYFNKHFPPLNRKWTSTNFPTTRELIYTMKRNQFYVANEPSKKCLSFHKAFEGFCGPHDLKSDLGYMHNKVHDMVSGSMCCSTTAANDPLFLLHHSFVDKMLDAWIKLWNPSPLQLPDRNSTISQFRESFVVGLLPLVKQIELFVTTEELGYVYDNNVFGKAKTSFEKV